MDRYLEVAYSATPPSAPPASSGYPTNGNPVAGTPASEPGEWWFHMITEELRAVIAAAALTPDHTNLTQLSAAIQAMVAKSTVFPFAALPFPTIATSTNVLTVTPGAVAGQGGTVSIPSGVYVSICEALNASIGRKLSYQTSAWTSGNLAVSSTYFLRCRVIGGVLTFYTQKGTDTDATPGTLVGTVAGASGGGFDSTCLDMLVAKVVTGTAGTTPTVTALANSEWLFSRTMASDSFNRTTGAAGGIVLKRATALTLNWARTPTVYQTRTAYGIIGAATAPEELNVIYSGSAADGTGSQTAAVSRYVFDPIFSGDWNSASTAFAIAFQTDYLVEA